MLSVAVTLLTLAVVFGTGLALWHLKATDETSSRPPALAGMIHGGIAAVGLGALLLVLRGPARGVSAGVGSFGLTAAILFAAALLTGLVLWRRRSVPAVVMAIHSGFAITGYVLLLAWNSLG